MGCFLHYRQAEIPVMRWGALVAQDEISLQHHCSYLSVWKWCKLNFLSTLKELAPTSNQLISTGHNFKSHLDSSIGKYLICLLLQGKITGISQTWLKLLWTSVWPIDKHLFLPLCHIFVPFNQIATLVNSKRIFGGWFDNSQKGGNHWFHCFPLFSVQYQRQVH